MASTLITLLLQRRRPERGCCGRSLEAGNVPVLGSLAARMESEQGRGAQNWHGIYRGAYFAAGILLRLFRKNPRQAVLALDFEVQSLFA